MAADLLLAAVAGHGQINHRSTAPQTVDCIHRGQPGVGTVGQLDRFVEYDDRHVVVQRLVERVDVRSAFDGGDTGVGQAVEVLIDQPVVRDTNGGVLEADQTVACRDHDGR